MLTFPIIASVEVDVDVDVGVGGEVDCRGFVGFFALSSANFVTKLAVESGRIN